MFVLSISASSIVLADMTTAFHANVKSNAEVVEGSSWEQNFTKSAGKSSKKAKLDKLSETFGKEKIAVKFPEYPTYKNLSSDPDIGGYVAGDKEAVYTMMVPVEPIKVKDKKQFLNELENELEQTFNIISSTVSQKNGQRILDFVYESPADNIYGKSRVVVTNENFYILNTNFKKWEKEQHQRFVESFNISK